MTQVWDALHTALLTCVSASPARSPHITLRTGCHVSPLKFTAAWHSSCKDAGVKEICSSRLRAVNQWHWQRTGRMLCSWHASRLLASCTLLRTGVPRTVIRVVAFWEAMSTGRVHVRVKMLMSAIDNHLHRVQHSWHERGQICCGRCKLHVLCQCQS